MTTRTKIFTGLLLSSVLATGLFATCNMQNKNMMQNNQTPMQGKMMNKHYEKDYMHKGSMQIKSIINQLNLSDSQRVEIRDIMIDARKQRETLNDAFTKNTFDKSKFIEIMNSKRENMIKSKADMIEKMYAVLDSKQKEQFKTLLELKSERMMNRFN